MLGLCTREDVGYMFRKKTHSMTTPPLTEKIWSLSEGLSNRIGDLQAAALKRAEDTSFVIPTAREPMWNFISEDSLDSKSTLENAGMIAERVDER